MKNKRDAAKGRNLQFLDSENFAACSKIAKRMVAEMLSGGLLGDIPPIEVRNKMFHIANGWLMKCCADRSLLTLRREDNEAAVEEEGYDIGWRNDWIFDGSHDYPIDPCFIGTAAEGGTSFIINEQEFDEYYPPEENPDDEEYRMGLKQDWLEARGQLPIAASPRLP